MAELLAALGGLITAFFEALPVVLRTLLYVVAVSVTIVVYLVSPKFRLRKQQEWKQKPIRKYTDLTISAVCLSATVAFSLWLILPEAEKPGAVNHFDLEYAKEGEDARFVVITDVTNRYRFAVKDGGISNIFGTKTLSELSNAIRQNVTKVGGSNHTGKSQPSK